MPANGELNFPLLNESVLRLGFRPIAREGGRCNSGLGLAVFLSPGPSRRILEPGLEAMLKYDSSLRRRSSGVLTRGAGGLRGRAATGSLGESARGVAESLGESTCGVVVLFAISRPRSSKLIGVGEETRGMSSFGASSLRSAVTAVVVAPPPKEFADSELPPFRLRLLTSVMGGRVPVLVPTVC